MTGIITWVVHTGLELRTLEFSEHVYAFDILKSTTHELLEDVGLMRWGDLAPRYLAVYEDAEFEAILWLTVSKVLLDVHDDSEAGTWNGFNERCCFSAIVLWSVFDGILATDTDGDTSTRKATGTHGGESAV
jgi:hypothetical protein